MMRHWHEGDEELHLLREIRDLLILVVAILDEPVPQSTTAILKGPAMPVQVGATEPVTLTFVDGAVTPPTDQSPPTGDGSGLVVTIASDNTAVATVGAVTASGDTAVASVTGVSAGSYNLTATVANTSGAALLDNDGVTPFVQPSPLADTVTAPPPAQATTAVLSVG